MKLITSNSLFIGKVANYLAKVDSTNVYAMNLLSKSTPIEGTVIYTDNQYAGRGQIGSKWESPIGKNITFSIILYPNFLPIHQQFKLNQAVSLAVYDLISQYVFPLEKLKIKWPNDIYIDNKKAGGILIENKIKGVLLGHSVIGIGLNINQNSFSPDLSNPTSLLLETGRENDIYDMMGQLCEQLEFRYLQLKAQKYELLDQDYQQVLYGFQEWRTFLLPNSEQEFKGKIIGINEQGKLIIQTAQQRYTFAFKEVIFL